jgi:glycosyltransferase involved in cell wall biosynthesis
MNVIIIVEYDITEKNRQISAAATARFYNLAKLIQKSGCSVKFVFPQKSPMENSDNQNSYYETLDIEFHPLCVNANIGLNKLSRIKNQLKLQQNLVEAACEYANTLDGNSLILCTGYYLLGHKLLKENKRNRKDTRIGFIMNDWIRPSIKNKIYSVNVMLGRLFVYSKMDAGLVQSEWLAKKYPHVAHKIVVPALLEDDWFSEPLRISRTSGKIKIAFAGSVGMGHDRIDLVLKAISILPNEIKDAIELHLYINNISALMDLMDESVVTSDNCVFIHEPVSRKDLREILMNMDYTIFIRDDNERSSAGKAMAAGFPGKLAESFALGVPVIANYTGEVGKHLVDGKTGFRIREFSVESVVEALERAVHTSAEENYQMRIAAYKRAKECFTIDGNVNAMKDFIYGIEIDKEVKK